MESAIRTVQFAALRSRKAQLLSSEFVLDQISCVEMEEQALPFVQQKEIDIENTLDKIRHQLAAMRSQDATLQRQVNRIKMNIEDITVEIEAMIRPQMHQPVQTRSVKTSNNCIPKIRQQPASPESPELHKQWSSPVETWRIRPHSSRSLLPRQTSHFYEDALWDEGTPATLGRPRSVSEPHAKFSGSSGSVNSITSTGSRLSSDTQPTSPLATCDSNKDQDQCKPGESIERKSSTDFSRRRSSLSRAFSSFRKARVGRWLLRRFSPTDLSSPSSLTDVSLSVREPDAHTII